MTPQCPRCGHELHAARCDECGPARRWTPLWLAAAAVVAVALIALLT